MKNRISKKITIISGLLVCALAGACILATRTSLLSGQMAETAIRGMERDQPPARKKTVLLEAALGRENELQVCYQAFLKTAPTIDEGVVEMHWMLDKYGKITSMEMVHTDLDDRSFTDCLLEKMRKMTFKSPPKARPTLVAHKFNFHKRTPANLDFKQARESAPSEEADE